MSDLYDINFQQQAIENLPPDKRASENVAFVTAVLSALQWMRDLLFGSYKKGAIAPAYAPGTYTQYFQVQYNNGVYESLINGNTDAPTTSNWRLIQPNFIGIDERITYNASLLSFEWALNKWFHTTFRQPPSLPDIYITNTVIPPASFVVGINGPASSSVGVRDSSEFVGPFYDVPVNNNFVINIPTAIYTALGVNAEQVVRNFADRINNAGLFYTIQTY